MEVPDLPREGETANCSQTVSPMLPPGKYKQGQGVGWTCDSDSAFCQITFVLVHFVAVLYRVCTLLRLMQACVAAMVRIEHMDFLLPMKIGEVAELTAEIVYTSTHSLLVAIKVHAENITTGKTVRLSVDIPMNDVSTIRDAS